MFDFFSKLFESSEFMPHGHCYFWQKDVLWTNIIGDGLTALAYFIIPLYLIYFSRKRKDVDFNNVIILFGAFILFCGATHVSSIHSIWVPSYRLEGLLKMLTGIISMITAGYLYFLVPKAIKIPSPKELQAVNQEIASFSYTVAHDLRSPLRHINSFASILSTMAKEKLSDDEQIYIANIQEICGNMSLKIDELLKYSHIQKQDLVPQEIDTKELIQKLISDFEPDIRDRNITWEIEKLDRMVADHRMIKDIFLNLIDNAIKYTSKENKAIIRLSVESNIIGTTILFSDNGVGFDMAFQEKLFTPFERLHDDEEFEGNGIGLAYVYRIVKKHKGKISAESLEGEGATFHIFIPKMKVVA